MITPDLDIENIAASPTEANAVLIVNVNTVLPLPAAFQRLQTVAPKRTQIAQRPGCIQHAEFLKRLSVTLLESPAAPGGVQPLCLAIPERLNHCKRYNARRYTRGARAASPFLRPSWDWQALDRAPALTRWATFWRRYGAEHYTAQLQGPECLNSLWWAWASMPPTHFRSCRSGKRFQLGVSPGVERPKRSLQGAWRLAESKTGSRKNGGWMPPKQGLGSKILRSKFFPSRLTRVYISLEQTA